MKAVELVEAARGGNLVALRATLAAGADPNATTGDGITALEGACGAGRLAAARLLLQSGAVATPRVWLSLGADPAMSFLVETADLGSPLPSWLAGAIAKEEATADSPALIHAVVHGAAPARRAAMERLAAAVLAGAPWAPALAALAGALKERDPEVAASAARMLDRLARSGRDVPVEVQALGLLRQPRPPDEHALLVEALSSAERRGETAFMERVLLLRNKPGAADTAARALVTDALESGPLDWATIDRFCGHALPVVRRVAIEALGKAWIQGAAPAAGRIVAGLADEDASVRAQAMARLDEGWREGLLVPMPDALLVRLVARLRDQGSEAIGLVLSRQVASDRDVAARVRELLATGAEIPQGPVGELARECDAITEGRLPILCAACGPLGTQADWGDAEGQGPTVPEPPAFKRLRRAGPDSYGHTPYRCPACGSYFDLHEVQGDYPYGNSTWTSYTLRRCEGSAPEILVNEAVRTGDFAALGARLVGVSDDVARKRILDVLAPVVREGQDVAVLQPALVPLTGAGVAANLRRAALSVLTLHALRTGDVARVTALVESGDDVARSVALDTLLYQSGWPAARDCALRLRPTLWALAAEEGGHRSAAVGLLEGLALDRETIAEAGRSLESDRRHLRDSAVRVVAAATKEGTDVRAFLPRLAALAADEHVGRAALEALTAADRRGANLAPFVPALAAVVRAWPQSSRARDVARLLQALQRKGVDVSSAMEPLALLPEWLVRITGDALDQRRDISAALPYLQHIAAGNEGQGGYLSRTAVEILTRHFVRERDWAALAPLLRNPDAERAGIARAIVERAVLSGEATNEALLFLGSVEAADASPSPALAAVPTRPALTSWSKDRHHIEVNEREVLAWTDSQFGGDGRSCPLEAFLADSMMQTGIVQTFGARVLREVVEATRWFISVNAAPRPPRPKRKRKHE